MPRGLWYVIAIAAVLLAVGAAGELSLRSATCMACHKQEAAFTGWMKGKLVADKKGFGHELIGCADCHILGSPAGTVMSRLRGILHAVTYAVPQIDPRSARVSGLFYKTRVPTENCQYCHLAAQTRKQVFLKDLPAGLKKIGLVMDHRKHVLARDDTCSRCHERYKDKEASQADRGTNYAEVNHMACDSCHATASHSYRSGLIMPIAEKEYVAARQNAWDRLSTNPRWMVAVPPEKTCRRCHNGKIHYKTPIFVCDCREGKNYENCLKCHPLMTKDYFEQYRKDQEKVGTASNSETDGPGRLAGNNGSKPQDRMTGRP
jgi:nitrate/TMAO reductase-like tetraheme cytochrome c subunit